VSNETQHFGIGGASHYDGDVGGYCAAAGIRAGATGHTFKPCEKAAGLREPHGAQFLVFESDPPQCVLSPRRP
jgi:hypothetical protein